MKKSTIVKIALVTSAAAVGGASAAAIQAFRDMRKAQADRNGLRDYAHELIAQREAEQLRHKQIEDGYLQYVIQLEEELGELRQELAQYDMDDEDNTFDADDAWRFRCGEAIRDARERHAALFDEKYPKVDLAGAKRVLLEARARLGEPDYPYASIEEALDAFDSGVYGGDA